MVWASPSTKNLLHHAKTPVRLSRRLVKLKIRTRNGHLVLFSMYVSTMEADVDEKDSFYRLMEEEAKNIHAHDSLVVLGIPMRQWTMTGKPCRTV